VNVLYTFFETTVVGFEFSSNCLWPPSISIKISFRFALAWLLHHVSTAGNRRRTAAPILCTVLPITSLGTAISDTVTNPATRIIGVTYAHRHRLTLFPHARRSTLHRSTLHRLPRPTHGTVSRARVVESRPPERDLQQCLDRRCWPLPRRDVHSHVQRYTAMDPSVEWITRKTGALRSPGLRSIHQYD
jgi:hypothetical protein